MAYGKNKKLSKGKKGSKKKQLDPFLRKNWYDIKAPVYLNAASRRAGRTCVTKTTGQRIETEGLKNRVAEFNLADLAEKNEDSFKKMKLEVMDITGRNCLSDFNELSLTRDKTCHMIRKRHSLIEARADVKTTDGYVVRVFVVAFTKDAPGQVKVFSYAQTAQVKKIRKKIVGLLQAKVSAGSLKDLVNLLIANTLEKEVANVTQSVYPCDPVHVYKVKLIKKPKLDVTKLYDIHGGANAVSGSAAEGAEVIGEVEEAKNLLSQ